MVVTVSLSGLNVRQAKGRWYISVRETGDSLVRGFVGTKADALAQLGNPEVLFLYSRVRLKEQRRVYADGTLGQLVAWFKADCPRWKGLSDVSRAEYEKSFLFLEEWFDVPVAAIDQPQIYDVRNKAANQKWHRFADKMVSHLSTIFHEATKVRKASGNPAAGIEKLHKADPNANHEWRPDEVTTVFNGAPQHVLTPLMIARHAGFSGQTIATLQWSAYIPHPEFGRALQAVRRKNNVASVIPCDHELRAYLDGLTRTALAICTRKDGTPWEDEKQMQGVVSDYFERFKEKGLIRKGCTLHGLRVTYAAGIRRDGHDAGTVADALGDQSKAMGEHYTRHVEREASVLRVFRKRVVQNNPV